MDSTQGHESDGLTVVKVLAVVLERLVHANSHFAEEDEGQVTKFHALRAPAIGIGPYLERIHKYASCSKECFILALVYIDRLIHRNSFRLTELNVHRVVITAILLAAKFFDDAYYNNAYYAKVGGVLVSEMNSLEVEFLFRINFSLRVQRDVFDNYNSELISHASAMGLLFEGLPQQPKQVSLGNYFIPVESSSNHHLQMQRESTVVPVTQAICQEPCICSTGTLTSQFTVQNTTQISPSPPPPRSHLVSYDCDLAGATYDPFTTQHYQVTQTAYIPSADMSASSTHDMLLELQTQILQSRANSNWSPAIPHASARQMLEGAQYQDMSCTMVNQRLVNVPQPAPSHHNYSDYVRSDVIEWQMHQSGYCDQQFATKSGSEHPLRNIAHYVNYPQVES